MSSENENSVARVLAAIERVRYERSEATVKYDSALAKLVAAGRDLGAEIPDDHQSLGRTERDLAAEVPANGPAPDGAEGRADQIDHSYFERFPGYWECPICGLLHPMGWYSDCRNITEDERDKLSFVAEELDEKYSKGRWLDFSAFESGTNELERGSLSDVDHLASTSLTQSPEVSAVISSISNGIREGATKHRVLMITERLLQEREWVSIQEILNAALSEGIFVNAENPKQFLYNVLSQLKARNLLTSDGRGNWSSCARKVESDSP
jgi:hypothetical protein